MSQSAPSSATEHRQSPWPRAGPALTLLLAVNLFNYIDRYVLAAVEPEVRATFLPHDPSAKAKMGLLATAFMVTYMLTAPLFGYLADRISRWRLIAISVALWSLATGFSGLAASFLALLIARMFVGIGEAGYGPAAPTLISDFYTPSRRGSRLAWFYVAIPVGSALGYAIGSSMKSWFSWRSAFYVAMFPGLLLALLALRMRDPPRGQSDGINANQPRAKPTPRDYLALLRTPSYVLNNIAMAMMTFAIGGISYWLPDYLQHARNLGPQSGTMLGGVLCLGGLLATPLGGYLGDRLRPRIPGANFLVSGLGMLIGAAMVAFLPFTPFPAAWYLVLAAIFFLFLNTGPANTALADVTHPAVRATAFAFNILVIHLLGDAAAPPLLGYVADRSSSWTPVFELLSIVMAVSGAIWLIAMPSLSKDIATLHAQIAQRKLTQDQTSQPKLI